MALPATLVWEVRPTNGTADAGGGFDPSVASPGTDRSQQNAAQIAYTDLVIGGTTTQLTSVLSPFTSAEVGNNIAVTGGTGFTTGIYNVRSVAGITATMDRSVGTGASTGGTGNLGGARSGFSNGTTALQGNYVAGNKIWVKQEAWNEAVSMTVAGAATTPVIVEGYKTARGDGTTDANRPQNNRASAAGDGITAGAVDIIYKHLDVTAAGDAGFSVSGAFAPQFIHCKANSNTGEGLENSNGQTLVCINCEFGSNGGPGIGSTAVVVGHGNYVHDNTGKGMVGTAAGQWVLTFNIIEANANHGVDSASAGMMLMSNTIDGNTGASTDGWNCGTIGANLPNLNYNNIFSNNGRDGARGTSAAAILCDNNDYFGNVGTARTSVPAGGNDVALDPTFTNRSGADFSIGTNLKALGFPGVFPAALSTGYLDIGAVQRQETGGGGAGIAHMAGAGGGFAG